MPIDYRGERAIRAIRGDVNGTPSVASDHSDAANIEFVRIYKGSDLKFDRWNETYLCFHNDTANQMSLSFLKQGTGWSSNVVVKWISSSNLNVENTMTLAAGTQYTGNSGTNTITVPANGRVYIRNGNASQRHFCESASNYITVYSNRSFHVTGNWLALVPGTPQTSNQWEAGSVDSYAFYCLFQNCTNLTSVPDLDRKVNGRSIGAYGTNMFSHMFEGCTGLTHAPAIDFDCSLTTSAFAYIFQNCTGITSAGDIEAVNLFRGYPTQTNPWIEGASRAFEGAYRGCNRLVQGPNITQSETEGYIGGYALYQTFYGCTSMTSIRGLTVMYVSSSGMEQTFYNCTSFTGQGLSVSYRKVEEEITNKYFVADIWLSGSRCLYQTFYSCSSMTKIFGQYFDPNYVMLDSYLIAFQLTGTTDSYAAIARGYRMYQTFYGCSSLDRGSTEYIRMSDGLTAGNKIYYEYDFYECFRGCTNLDYVQNMFKSAHPEINGNWSLYSNGAERTFYGMFNGCTSMTSFTFTMADTYGGSFAFAYMFYGCSALQRVSGSLPRFIYGSDFRCMFRGCTSLISGPIITTDDSSTSNAFYQMFYGCSSLKYIVANITSFNSSNMYQWTYGTQNGGTGSNARYFIAINPSAAFSNSDWNTSGNTTENNTYRIPYNWNVQSSPIVVTIGNSTSANVSLRKYGTPSGTHTFNYINMTTGQSGTYNPGSTQNGDINAAGPFVIWGTSDDGNLSDNASNYYYFRIVGSARVYGSPYSLCKTSNPMPLGTHRFYRLFYNCTGIEDASGLGGFTGTIEAEYQYSEMFRGCTKLEKAPDISFNFGTLGGWACYKMFLGCTALASPPDLSGCTSNGATGVFCSMFQGCTSLTTVANIPASVTNFILGPEAFESMYQGCSSITDIPSGYLPWTSLATQCYLFMFANCTSLASVPEDLLPATNLTGCDSCYNNMFENCTSLTEAPALPSTDTKNVNPYGRMFKGCTSLQRMNVSFTSWKKAWGMSTTRDTWDWTNGVPTTGIFRCNSALTQYRNNSSNSGNSVSASDGCTDTSACYIPYGWTIVTNNTPNWTDLDGMIVMERASGSVTIAPNGTRGQQLEYTLNGLTWNNFTSSVTVSSSQTKIGFRAGSEIPTGRYQDPLFLMTGTGKVNVSGNINRCFHLSRTTPTNASGMFKNCQRISNCNGLYFKSGPISAAAMFYASSVTSVRQDLICNHPSMSTEGNFEDMFGECTSLTQGPYLYTQSLVHKADYRWTFYGCTSLSSMAVLGKPVSGGTCQTTFAAGADDAYKYAFQGCSNLHTVKINFNYLGQDTEGNYLNGTFFRCFAGCSSLSELYSKQVRWPVKDCCNNWLELAGNSNSVFYKYSGNGLGTQRGNSRIPYGWDVSTSTWT